MTASTSASAAPAAATDTARDYYNSPDADRFYATIWGGEDIHVGIYESNSEAIAEASRRTVDRMAALLRDPGTSTRIADLGSGYCGAARALASRFQCKVFALNLSDVENRRARALNREHKLDHLIEVTDGSFEQVPLPDRSVDAVWSQDAILHSGDRARVFREVSRILAPGGQLVMTDPMESDTCPPGVLGPILDRIHLADLGSPGRYRRLAAAAGLEEVEFHDLTAHLVRHYTRVLEETDRRASQLTDISAEYIARMKVGLQHWIDGGRAGHLSWGILHFRKAD